MADDVGSTPTATRHVLDLWVDGSLDGLSLFGNGDALDDVGARLRARPDLPAQLAVHLNLSEGPPVAPAAEVPLLVDGAGRLRHSFGSLLLAWLRADAVGRAALVGQVEREWRAQVERVARACAPRRLDGVDGHIHVHALPFLFPVAARLAAEHGIRAIRVPREPLHLASPSDLLRPWFAKNLLKNAVLRGASLLARRVAQRERLERAGFIGILYSGHMTVGRLEAGVAAALRDGPGEVLVVVHVGRPSDAERERWRGRDWIWADAADPQRDVERAEVRRFAATQARRA